MPTIPMPPSTTQRTFNQSAQAIPEFSVRATGDAFGAGAAEATYRGEMQQVSNIAAAGKAENHMWTTAISSVMKQAGEIWQRDQKLEAEAKLQELSLNTTKSMDEDETATGDGTSAGRIIKSFDERAAALVDGAQTPYQANILREGIQHLRFKQQTAAVGREVAARKQARLDQANTLIEGAEVEVFRDPTALAAVRERVMTSLGESALSPKERSRAIELADKKLHAITLEKMMITGNLAGVQELLKADTTIKAIGGLDSLRFEARVRKAAEEVAERAAAAEAARKLATGETTADPLNTEHRKMIDSGFEAIKGPELLAAGDPAAESYLITVAKKTGIVPAGALTVLNGAVLNGTEEQQIRALRTVAALERAYPGVLDATGAHKKLRERAEYFETLTSGREALGLGLDPMEAMKRVRERMTPAFEERMKARKEQTDRELKDMNESIIANEFGSLWNRLPGTEPMPVVGNPRDRAVIFQQFKEAYKYHVNATGDETEAKAAAIRDIKRVYGVTRLTGDGTPTIVRNPPELRLPPIGPEPSFAGRDTRWDWVKTQLVAEIKKATGRDVDPSNIRLEATPATDAALARGGVSAGVVPPYAFYWREPIPGKPGELGPPQTLPGKLFTPDIAAARAAENARVLKDRESIIGSEADRAAAVRRLSGARTGAPTPSVRAVTGSDAPVTTTIKPDGAIETRPVTGAPGIVVAPPKKPSAAEARGEARSSLFDLLGFGAAAIGVP